MNVKKLLFYLTITSIATEALQFNIGFDFKYFYLVILFGSFTLILVDNFHYSKGLLFFHVYILFSGLITIVFGYNKMVYFVGQLFFLILIPTFYNSFFKLFDLKKVVAFYCKLSVVLAVIGLIKLPHDISNGSSLHSILIEPAHYSTLVLPALFITFKSDEFPRWYYMVILISIIFSGSSLGYLGIGLGLLLLPNQITLGKMFSTLVLVITLGILTYSYFTPFRIRLDDTIASVSDGDLSRANLSTYALISNLYVSLESFKASPIFGNGIGSHLTSRSMYLTKVEGIEEFEKMGMDHLNAKDAASLFLRLVSETGVIGLFAVMYFIYRNLIRNTDLNNDYGKIVCKAILIYFFCKLLREGHYFSPEMYFFVFLFVYNRKASLGANNLNMEGSYKPFRNRNDRRIRA